MTNKYNIGDDVFAFTPTGVFKTRIIGVKKNYCGEPDYLIDTNEGDIWYSENWLLPDINSLGEYFEAVINNFGSLDFDDDHDLTPSEMMSDAMKQIMKAAPKFEVGQKVFVIGGDEIFYDTIRKIEGTHYCTGSPYSYTLMDGQSWLEAELFGSEKEVQDYFYRRIQDLVREDKEND